MRILLFLFILSSCSKPSTSLEFTIKDHLGLKVPDALVTLYGSQNDLLRNQNILYKPKFTDNSGVVRFSDLETRQYFFSVSSGCLSNRRNQIATFSSIVEDKINTINVTVQPSGNLVFSNKSSNPYKIFINGTFAFDLPGKTIYLEKNMTIGTYTIRVLQISGYVLFPTDLSYTVPILCGETSELEFP